MPKERFTIYLEPDFIQAVKMLALRRGISATEYVTKLLMKDRNLAAELPKMQSNGKKVKR